MNHHHTPERTHTMMQRTIPALAVSALMLTGCGGGEPSVEHPAMAAPPESAAATTSPAAPEPEITVSVSTTHDDGAVLTWGAQRQEVSAGGEISLTFDALEPGERFELDAAGAPQSSAVVCKITVDGEVVELDHGAGAMPSATCTMPQLND